jgi:hypothetical protein
MQIKAFHVLSSPLLLRASHLSLDRRGLPLRPTGVSWKQVCVLTWSPGEEGRTSNVWTIESPDSCPLP